MIDHRLLVAFRSLKGELHPAVFAWTFVCWGLSGELSAEPAFRFQKRVELPEITEQELIAVPLDADVYEAVQDGFEDLRLIDADGRAIPFLLRTAAETRFQTRRQFRTVETRTARPLDDGGLEILLTLDDDDPPVNGVRLVSPLSDFEHRVRVFGSPDGEDWQLLTDDGLIFDYARFIDVRNDTIAVPETRQRHLRIVIDDVTADQESRLLELTRRLRGSDESERTERIAIDRRPFRVDRVEVWQDVRQQRIAAEKRTEIPVAGFHVEADRKSGRTIITIDTRREPLRTFTIETPTRNFSRRAAVEIPDIRSVPTNWRTIVSGPLAQFDFRDLQREDLSLDFPETRQRQYRLVIENRDSPPLEITGVMAEGTVKELVFFASPDSEPFLLYGDPHASAASHDTAAIAASLAEGYEPQPAALGPQSEHIRTPRPLRLADLLNNRWLLLGILALLATTLGWFLYQATQRLPPAQDPSDED